MVGHHASGGIGRKHATMQARSMPINDQALLARCYNLRQYLFITLYNPWHVHHLGQAQYTLILQQRQKIIRHQYAIRAFICGSRDTGREHYISRKGQSASGFQHVANAFAFQRRFDARRGHPGIAAQEDRGVRKPSTQRRQQLDGRLALRDDPLQRGRDFAQHRQPHRLADLE